MLIMVSKTKVKSKEAVTDRIETVRSSVSKAAKKGRAVAGQSVHKSRRAIQSKPLTAVGAGIAAGAAAGVVAGVLLTRKKTGGSGMDEAEDIGEKEEIDAQAESKPKSAAMIEEDEEIIDDED
jgi:ElaB/YqjD/DUF883 family membrane-anchored ribosome-binding protein